MDRRIAQDLDPKTPFLTDPAAQKLCQVLEDAGHVALFVGGCVRNALLGLAASDIDISTDATPDQVMRIVKAAGFRAIPTGVDHGTVTVVARGDAFEVTTFRRDVATDGRRAVVAFSTHIEDDARRRDFTMNAIYADRRGTVVDPLHGLPDLQVGRIRFIEDAGQRIREDYLRTLRFFRFHAWYAAPDQGWDAEALDGIATNLDELETLSAERVGAEMVKLLSAPDPAPALAVMAQTGVLSAILPGADPTLVAPLVHLEQGVGAAADPVTRLAALGGEDVADRLRLSRADQKRLASIRDHSTSALGAKAIGHMAGKGAGFGAILLRAVMANTVLDVSEISEVAEGAQAEFPIKASDLPDLQGKALGDRLAALKSEWLASNLEKSKNALLGA
ncbi:CCA tRNA nucleotidyltransferase [uncultured Tateyamaria sp.]|uniref:CCA tRNA nucleotidyltransferase n=1 Tax=uncultured Tateyamaria sp. TaxID=455651 RepID=UPI002602D1D9|nr:CCA tRNA nucleotidyltransferase [uncultured Tateyamaria sp.]